jgi:hypothetical protein
LTGCSDLLEVETEEMKMIEMAAAVMIEMAAKE